MIEALEPRRLLSVTLTGTPGNDAIDIQQQSDGRIFVWINRPETSAPNIRLAAGTALAINGGGGQDDVRIDNLIAAPISANINGSIELADSGQDLTISSGNVTIELADPQQPARLSDASLTTVAATHASLRAWVTHESHRPGWSGRWG